MHESILIVEDEEDIARLVAINLEGEGYECHIVGRGDDALSLAPKLRPDLVLLDLMLPGLDGVEVCRQLRQDPRTAAIGIIMLTARALPEDRIAGLEAGADDYVDKPFHVEELLARVHTSLRRARQLRATSPLTGLPGNFEIESRLDVMIAAGEPFALLHADLDAFKAYNDRYGFVRGDQAIVHTARVITQAALEAGDADTFVGHIGGDDFAVLVRPDLVTRLADLIISEFDATAVELYDEDDRAAGCIELVDRTGVTRRRPFVTVSIGIASSEVRSFASSTEAAAVAAELKRFAKAETGSAWRIDRRRTVES